MVVAGGQPVGGLRLGLVVADGLYLRMGLLEGRVHSEPYRLDYGRSDAQ